MNSTIATFTIERSAAAGEAPRIIELAALRRFDAPLAGGKAATLGELMARGFAVPQGVVATVAAYRSFVAQDKVREPFEALTARTARATPAGLTDISAEVAGLFLKSQLPAWGSEILDWARSSGSSFAVRSSATNEDLAGATFAGQYDSFINVSLEAIPDAIRRCFASLYNARAILYRRRKNIATVGDMSVILQKMVTAEAAGVIYTRAPRRERQLLIEIAAGAGDRVVSGVVTPNRYYLDRDTLDITESATPDPGLHPDLRAIAECALTAETELGYTTDLEFAIESGALRVLQARPVAVGAQ